jgi:acetolactate synthase-1/2/3 large subunit
MKETGGRAVVRALEDEGVRYAFGIPGTHNIELYDALSESEAVTPVLVTDEQSASFMADAVWRASGQLACVNVVPGAGLTHAMSGIAEAYMDNAAVLVLGCGIRTDTGHAYQLHDVDQVAMVAPVTKAQLRVASGPELYATIRRACAIAQAGAPGPVFVEVPANLYMIPHARAGTGSTAGPGGGPTPGTDPGLDPPLLDISEVERAAEILLAAGRPLLYLGLGAAGAGRAALVQLAEALESPVSTTFQGKGVFPESHPLYLWPGFGRSAPRFARQLATACDATLAIGCRFSEVGTGSYGLEPPGPLIHVDIESSVLDRNFPAEVAIAADAGQFVAALLEVLARRLEDRAAGPDPDLRSRIAAGHAEVRKRWAEEEKEPADGVSPPLLLRSLQQQLGPETIFTADSGNGTFLGVECLRLDEPGRFLAPVDYSCMGYAVPAAIGAGLARPDSTAVALAGDGAFLMTGLELLTAAAHPVPILVVVLRDKELAQIAQFQGVAMNRKVASQLPDYDLAAICRGVGVECLPLAGDEQIGEVLRQAKQRLTTGRPVALDVAIDYSKKTYFTRGVVKANLLRLPWRDRVRMVGRAVARRLTG